MVRLEVTAEVMQVDRGNNGASFIRTIKPYPLGTKFVTIANAEAYAAKLVKQAREEMKELCAKELEPLQEHLRHFNREVERRIEAYGPLQVRMLHPDGYHLMLNVVHVSWPRVEVAYDAAIRALGDEE